MLSVTQGAIKYDFLSLWYYSTWDWTQVTRAIGEYSNHHANVRYFSIIIDHSKLCYVNYVYLLNPK